MKSPLRVGAVAAPKRQFLNRSSQPSTGKARRIASLSAAAAIVVGVGAASALFVDYLADRALAREAEAPVTVKPAAVKPVMAKAVETTVETKVAALARPATAPGETGQPPKAEIAVQAPDPAAIAKVAIGPEHAIELPTEDPTASPVVRAGTVPEGDAPHEHAPKAEPFAADAADGTQTAAITSYAEPAPGEAVNKPKHQKAEKAQPQAAAEETEVASLPGVDVGGLAGQASGEDDADGTVRTVTKPTTTGGSAARVTTAVNMRSSPKKGAGVLTVVPAGSAVSVLSCDGWCQITYNGRTGWIYKSYLSAASRAAPQKQQQAAKSTAPATAKPAPQQPAADPAAAEPRKAISSRL